MEGGEREREKKNNLYAVIPQEEAGLVTQQRHGGENERCCCYLQVYARALHRYKRDNEASYRNKTSVFHNTAWRRHNQRLLWCNPRTRTHTHVERKHSWAPQHHGIRGVTRSWIRYEAKTWHLGMNLSEGFGPHTDEQWIQYSSEHPHREMHWNTFLCLKKKKKTTKRHKRPQLLLADWGLECKGGTNCVMWEPAVAINRLMGSGGRSRYRPERCPAENRINAGGSSSPGSSAWVYYGS